MVRLHDSVPIDLTDSAMSTEGEGALLTEPGGPPMVAVARGLTKVYGEGNTQVVALDHVDIGFATGKLTAIMGPSGSGKSTLMHCMAGLDAVSAGEVRIGGTLIPELSDKELTLLRRRRMGFIFQSFNLVPTLTAKENIRLPLLLGGKTPRFRLGATSDRLSRPGRPA